MKTKLTLLTLTLTQTLPAQGEINIYEGGFTTDFQDSPIRRDRRQYNSRTLHSGIFGFGWCSDFDKKLVFKNAIEVQDCFGPVKNSKVEAEGSHYNYYVKGKKTAEFDLSGRLTQVYFSTNEKWTIKYNSSGKIYKIESNATFYRFEYNDFALVTKISGLNEIFDYTYSGQDLIEVRKNNSLQYSYQYDDLHNLTQINNANRVEANMTYDHKNDRVLSYKKGACKETFDYTDLPKEMQFIAIKKKTCASENILTTRFVFQHKKNKLNQTYLSSAEIHNHPQITRVEFHQDTGTILNTQVLRASRAMAFENQIKKERYVKKHTATQLGTDSSTYNP